MNFEDNETNFYCLFCFFKLFVREGELAYHNFTLHFLDQKKKKKNSKKAKLPANAKFCENLAKETRPTGVCQQVFATRCLPTGGGVQQKHRIDP